MLNLSQRRKRLLKDNLFEISMAAPQFILYVSLVFVPFIISIPVLFTDQSFIGDKTLNNVGLDNFIAIFKEPALRAVWWPAFGRTALFVVMNYAAVWLFGFSLALLMYEGRFRSSFFVVIYMPAMLSGLAFGYMISVLFSIDGGHLNLLFLKLGIIKEGIDVKSAQGLTWILPLLTGWRYAGFNLAIFLSGLLTIADDTIESAIIDGAGYLQRLIFIIIPQIIPAISIVSIFCLIGSWNVFGELVALGALYGNQSAVFTSIVIYQYAFSQGYLSKGLAISLELGIPLMIGAILLQRLQKRKF